MFQPVNHVPSVKSTSKSTLYLSGASKATRKADHIQAAECVEIGKIGNVPGVNNPSCQYDLAETHCKPYTQWLNLMFYPDKTKYQCSGKTVASDSDSFAQAWECAANINDGSNAWLKHNK